MNKDDVQATIAQLAVPIIDSISEEEIQNFKPYYERYYENKYCTSFNTETENHDILLRFHSNRLVLITIANGHDIFRENHTIESIDFVVKGVNLADINISGKKKAGAKKLKKNSILCNIKCKGVDKLFPIYTCVPASLIEVNHLILEDPNRLVNNYKETGFIGVLYPTRLGPSATSIDKVITELNLLSEDQYVEYCQSRT